MTPWERRKLAKKVEDRFHYTRKNVRFYTPEGEECTADEFEKQTRPAPLALIFDAYLTVGDRIRLHAWGVEA